jgi:hypothetical protein
VQQKRAGIIPTLRVSMNSSGHENSRFKFSKRSQLFIRSHNETLPVAAMCICNPDDSSVAVHG